MIKNIIFDLGNVLVNVHFERFRDELIKAGTGRKNFEELFHSKELKSKFESGAVSNKEFLQMVKHKLGINVSQKKFIDLFSDMFTVIPEMGNFIKKLALENKFRLILLSNTNSYHFNYIKRKFDYIRLFNKYALSYKLKMIKPSPTIYEMVLKRYKLKPDETLFIDDLEDNCKAAEKSGIKTICYKGYKSFKKEFDRMIK